MISVADWPPSAAVNGQGLLLSEKHSFGMAQSAEHCQAGQGEIIANNRLLGIIYCIFYRGPFYLTNVIVILHLATLTETERG